VYIIRVLYYIIYEHHDSREEVSAAAAAAAVVLPTHTHEISWLPELRSVFLEYRGNTNLHVQTGYFIFNIRAAPVAG